MLPTQKIYALISLEEYNAAKKAYIDTFSDGYHHLPVKDKWRIIIDKYKKISPEISTELEHFKSERENTYVNLLNISLEHCLAYFEHFCFLSETEDLKFKLSQDQKERLKEAVSDAMRTCETGKLTRFEEALQLYRNTGDNWVTKCLSDNRYHIVRRLHERYNHAFDVKPIMAVHTMSLMTQLAEERGLGIKMAHRIVDVYASVTSKQSITAYFDDNYPPLLSEYEDTLLQNLTHHLLFEITTLYAPQGQWQHQNGILISLERAQEFATFVKNRLGFARKGHTDIVELLGDWEQDGFQLKSKADIFLILYALIEEKLIKEQYFLELDQLNSSHLERFKALLNPRDATSLDQYVQLNEACLRLDENDEKSMRQVMVLTRNLVPLLNQCPGVILSQVEHHPILLELLPPVLIDSPLFFEPAIKVLDGLLNKAIDDNDEAQKDIFIHALVNILKDKPDCYHQLSPTLKQHQAFALRLVQKNGMFIRELPKHLSDQKAIIDAAIKQNPFVYVHLSATQKREYHREWQTIQHYFAECTKVELDQILGSGDHQDPTILQLLSTRDISTRQVARLCQHITPSQLIAVCEWRQRHNKPSLPYCDNINALKRFDEKIKSHHLDYWDKGYWSIKKEAWKRIKIVGVDNHIHDSLIDDLAQARYWFIVWVRHHPERKSFKNIRQFLNQLKHIMKRMASLMWIFMKIAMALAFELLVISYVDYLIRSLLSILFSPMILMLLIALEIYRVLFTSISTSIFITTFIATISTYWFMLEVALQSVFFLASDVPFLWVQLTGEITAFKNQISNLIKEPSGTSQSKALDLQCEESIARLWAKDSTSAQEKAAVLETLWNNIAEELPRRDDPHFTQVLKSLCNKAYPIVYHHQVYRVSFKEVAAMRRNQTNVFEMSQGTTSRFLGFFQKKTTTLQFLRDEEMPSISRS